MSKITPSTFTTTIVSYSLVIIYIWRHGKAETSSETGKDNDRTLSPEGRNEVIDVADHVFGAKKMKKPEKIFSSPFLRAKESAEMIQGFLACEKGLEILPELKAGTPFPELVSALKSKANDLKSFALVGHVPDLESLAFCLLDGNPDQEIHLKTGGLVQIEVAELKEPFRGKLLFSVNPKNIGV